MKSIFVDNSIALPWKKYHFLSNFCLAILMGNLSFRLSVENFYSFVYRHFGSENMYWLAFKMSRKYIYI